MSLGATGAKDDAEDEDDEEVPFGVRIVARGRRVSMHQPSFSFACLTPSQPFYTEEEKNSFRTLGLEPGW